MKDQGIERKWNKLADMATPRSSSSSVPIPGGIFLILSEKNFPTPSSPATSLKISSKSKENNSKVWTFIFLTFPFSLWTFIFPLLFGLFFNRGHFLDFFQIFKDNKLSFLSDFINQAFYLLNFLLSKLDFITFLIKIFYF